MSTVLVALGDLHGHLSEGVRFVREELAFGQIDYSRVIILQVGDLLHHPRHFDYAALPPSPSDPSRHVYFIDGNHDYLPPLLALSEPTEVAPGWTYCPRGSVLEIEGRRVGFLGGARSIDRQYRQRDVTWWPAEEVTPEQGARLHGEHLDLLVTHSPPRFVLEAMGYEDAQNDPCSAIVEEAWEKSGRPFIVCGHMHRRFRQPGIVTVLDLYSVELLQ